MIGNAEFSVSVKMKYAVVILSYLVVIAIPFFVLVEFTPFVWIVTGVSVVFWFAMGFF